VTGNQPYVFQTITEIRKPGITAEAKAAAQSASHHAGHLNLQAAGRDLVGAGHTWW
jgi:hypothetical protein